MNAIVHEHFVRARAQRALGRATCFCLVALGASCTAVISASCTGDDS